MKRYKASNIVPLTGIILLLVISIAGGLLLGLIAYRVSKLIYVVFLFPVGLGLAGGGLIIAGIVKGRVRNSLVAVGFGLLIGLVTYGTLRAAEYVAFRNDVREIVLQRMEQELGISEPDRAEQVVDQFLLEETGSTGFFAYLKLSSLEGITFTRLFSSYSTQLSPPLTWLYWLAELLIIPGSAAYLAYDAASRPFCEKCGEWYGPRKYLGGARSENEKLLLRAIEDGEFAEVGKLIQEEAAAPSIDVSVQACDCVTDDSVLVIEEVSINPRGKYVYKTTQQYLITPAERAVLGAYEQPDAPATTENAAITAREEADSETPDDYPHRKVRLVLGAAIIAIILVFFLFLLFFSLSESLLF